MTSNTPTPARPALDAMAMSEGDEPTPEAILIAAWKLRFNKAFRPEEEAGALMAFLDTVGLCVVSKRSLADMRGALEKAEKVVDRLMHHSCIADADPTDKDEYDNAAERDARAFLALARSAP